MSNVFRSASILIFQGEDVAPGIGRSNLVDAQRDWPDYTYEQLLDLVFDIMRERNPDMVAGEKKKFVMKPPQVARAGSKKTAFTNFADICRLLKRQPKHVLNFLLAELGTTYVRPPNSDVLEVRLMETNV